MHHLAAELLTTVTPAIVIAALVLCLGNVMARPLASQGDGPQQDARRCVEAPLRSMAESSVDGMARLCTDEGRVRPTLKVRGLQEGEAYTAWLAYFDRPSACFLSQCGFIDLYGDDPVGVLGRVSGAIAPPTRELELRADLHDLRPSMGAQVTLLVLGHGVGSATDGRARARQLLTPQMVELGSPSAGTLKDTVRGWLQAQAIFTIE
jgi:hypothetical protein